jgi:hypothetical protein
MALGSTQPLTEMSTRNLPGGKRRPARGADNLTAICERIVYKMWEPRRLTALWAFIACYRDSFALSDLHYSHSASRTGLIHTVTPNKPKFYIGGSIITNTALRSEVITAILELPRFWMMPCSPLDMFRWHSSPPSSR